MASVSWNSVLVDWVNCLKLSEPIKTIEDLSNGRFFRNLLKVLVPDQLTETADDLVFVIYKFFKANYPNYEFELEKSDLGDLNRHEFITITSLFMHFTCIIGRREDFIELLCSKLTQNVQVNIRAFLEEFSGTITREELDNYITEAMKVDNPSSTPSYNYFKIRTPKVMSSPLEDFLRTPTSRSRINSEIRKLKSALEMEKYEKSDLQEELKVQQDKIKKIAEHLQEKTEEISRLRSELVAFENKDPPFYQKDGNGEILQRKYQSEIQNLELYISQLEKEQQILQDDRDEMKEKLKKSEMQFKVYKEKFLQTENQNDNLTEKCKLQENEINNLQTLCNELNAVLSEFRNKNDSILEADSSFAEPKFRRFETNKSCEHLGETVIDLQLQDANKENLELKSVITELQQKEQNLNEDISKLHEKLSIMNQKFESSQNEIVLFQNNITTLEESQANLKNNLKLTEETLAEQRKQNIDFEEQIAALNIKLQKCETENLNLLKFKDELEALRIDFADSIEKYNNTNFELTSFKEKYANFDKEIEKSLGKLQNLVGCNNVLKLDDKVGSFANLLNKLNQNLLCDANNKKEMAAQIEILTEVSKKAELEIKELKTREVITMKEKDNLDESLHKAKNLIEVLQLELKALEDKLNSLNCQNDECLHVIDNLEKTLDWNFKKHNSSLKEHLEVIANNVIQEHNKNKQTIENYSLEIKIRENTEAKLKEDIQHLTSLIDDYKSEVDLKSRDLENTKGELEKSEKCSHELIKKCALLNEDILQFTSENEKLHLSLKNAKEEIQIYTCKNEELHKTLLEMEAEKTKRVKELIEEISNYKDEVDKLDSELRTIRQESEEKLSEFNQLVRIKDDEMQAKQNEIDVLSKKMELVNDTVIKLEVDLKKISGDKQNLQICLNEEKQINLDLKLSIKECSEEIETLKDDLATLQYQIDLKEVDIRNLKTQNKELDDEIQNLHNVVSQGDIKMSVLQNEFELKEKELLNSQEVVDSLNEKLAKYEAKSEEMANEIDLLKKLREQLEGKCLEYQTIMEKIIVDLSGKNQDYEKFIEEMQLVRTEKETKIQQLEKEIQLAQNNIEELMKDNNALISSHNEAIKNLREEKDNLLMLIEEKNFKEVEQLQEIRIIKDELNDMMCKYTQSLETYQESKYELETQNKTLTENLHEFIEKFNRLESVHEEKLQELDKNSNLIETLKLEKENVEKQSQSEKEQLYEEFVNVKNVLSDEIKELTEEKEKYIAQVENINAELLESKLNSDDLNNKLRNATNKVGELEKIQAGLLNEKLSLERDIQTLKVNNLQITKEHEEFRKEMERSNGIIKGEFDEEIFKLNKEKETLTKQVHIVENRIKDLEKQLCGEVKKHEISIKEQENVLKVLQTKLEEYEENVNRLNDEQNKLKEQLKKEEINYKELSDEFGAKNVSANMKIDELETTITKLKCANAILETGKEKLQNNHDKLLITINKLEEVIASKETLFNDQLKVKEFEIAHMKALVNSLESEAKDKQMLIEELRSDLDLINSNFEQVKKDKFTVQDSLVDLEKTYKETLNETRKSYKEKIQEVTNNYEELKKKNDEILKQLEETVKKNDYLEINIKEIIEEKNELQALIKEIEQNYNCLNEESTIHKVRISELEEKLVKNVMLIDEKTDIIRQLEQDKYHLQSKLDELSKELQLLHKSKEVILESQTKVLEETELNMKKLHDNAVETKNSLLKRIEIIESERNQEEEVRANLERVLNEERHVKDILNLRIIELENEKCTIEQLYINLKHLVIKLSGILQEKIIEDVPESDSVEFINNIIEEVEDKIIHTVKKSKELHEQVKLLEIEKNNINDKLSEVNNEKENILLEKAKLMEQYDVVCREKESLVCKSESNEVLENLKEHSEKLEKELLEVNEINTRKYSEYQELTRLSAEQKENLDKLLKNKNNLEMMLTTLKETLTVHLTKTEHLNEGSPQKQIFEKRQSLEIIIEDLNKQFIRLSIQISNIQMLLMNTIEKTMHNILNGKPISFDTIFNDVPTGELLEKIEILKDHMEDALEQQRNLEISLVKANIKSEKLQTKQKENIPLTGDGKVKEDDWKKKHFALKQRLTLAENAKNNFEKKIKQLREENKKLLERTSHVDDDQHYKILLQQHLQTKEQYEKAKIDFNNDYKKLLQEYEEYKIANRTIKVEDGGKLKNELQDIRKAYGDVLSDKSKMELENSSLRKILEDRSMQLGEMVMIKEAYEKLLEDNNQLQTEIDTLKYKRSRDRDEYVRLLKKEHDEFDNKESKKVHDVRMEYEGKLEKMKEKMIKLYKEEVNKEMKKVVVEKDENIFLLRTISELKEDLKDARSKIQKLERERNHAIENMRPPEFKRTENPMYSSRESLASITSRDSTSRHDKTIPKCASYSSFEIPIGKNPRMSTSSLGRETISRRNAVDERKISTLPRMVPEESFNAGKAPSIKSVSSDIGKNFEMEDEGDFFNTKYLADLKEGRCVLNSGRESAASRMSELAFRNSLCPPHLKSSYPAETQFTSPTMFKEEELKSGAVEFDDSMSSKLLPGDRPRNRKDIGTTSYKKPGPPTPSKNAGRMSLESNKVYPKEVLREHNDKTPKKATPNRLRALFMGKNSSARDNSENQVTPTKTKRLSIFKKPR